MTDPMLILVERALREPLFFGFHLAAYARRHGLDDAGLCAALGCKAEDLTMLRLCRRPRRDPAGQAEDFRLVVERFGLTGLAALREVFEIAAGYPA